MILIPFDPAVAADQEVRVTLATQPMTLRLYWNTASSFWFMNVTNSDGTKTVNSLKLVPGWPLFGVSRALAPVDGDFMVLRMDDDVADDIAYDDLGVRWGLFYLTDAELTEWKVQYGLE